MFTTEHIKIRKKKLLLHQFLSRAENLNVLWCKKFKMKWHILFVVYFKAMPVSQIIIVLNGRMNWEVSRRKQVWKIVVGGGSDENCIKHSARDSLCVLCHLADVRFVMHCHLLPHTCRQWTSIVLKLNVPPQCHISCVLILHVSPLKW